MIFIACAGASLALTIFLFIVDRRKTAPAVSAIEKAILFERRDGIPYVVVADDETHAFAKSKGTRAILIDGSTEGVPALVGGVLNARGEVKMRYKKEVLEMEKERSFVLIN